MRTLSFPYKIKSFPLKLLRIYGSSTALSTGGTLDARLADSKIETLFPDVSRDQAAAGAILYRKIFIKNESGLTCNTINFKIHPQANLAFGFGTDSGTFSSDGTVTQPDAAGTLILVSTEAADSMTMVILGENPVGTPAGETIILTGDTPVGGGVTFARILNMTLNDAPTGAVEVTSSNTIDTFSIGETFKFAFFTTETVSWGNLATNTAFSIWLRRIITASADPEDVKEFLVIGGS